MIRVLVLILMWTLILVLIPIWTLMWILMSILTRMPIPNPNRK